MTAAQRRSLNGCHLCLTFGILGFTLSDRTTRHQAQKG